jgi:hypothetical protein
MNFQQLSEAYSQSTMPQLSLGTAVLVIFIICAILVFVRGIFRILIGSATIAAAVYVGLWAWRESGSIAIRYTGKPLPWLDIAWPIVAGLITFVVLRLVTGFVMKPFSRGDGERPSFFGRLLRVPFALIPTALVCAAGVLLIQHVGNLGELRSFADRTNSTKRPEWAKIAEDLKKTVEANVPSAWVTKLDELNEDHLRLTLAKLITAKAENEVPPKAIVVLEEPALKAVVVDEARLKNLAKEKRYGSLLNHPDINKALLDPHVRKTLKNVDL